MRPQGARRVTAPLRARAERGEERSVAEPRGAAGGRASDGQGRSLIVRTRVSLLRGRFAEASEPGLA